MKLTFHYERWQLGLFYGYFGIFFIVGLLAIIPKLIKIWKMEEIVPISLLIMGGCEIFSSFHQNSLLVWLFAAPIALANVIAFTGLLTLFSNAANKKSQGWAMGIFASTIALSFTITGLSTNLLSSFKTGYLILIGGVIAIISSFICFFIKKQIYH